MSQATDLFIIGGGINGCGIARDAAAQVPGRIKQGTRGNPLAAAVALWQWRQRPRNAMAAA